MESNVESTVDSIVEHDCTNIRTIDIDNVLSVRKICIIILYIVFN